MNAVYLTLQMLRSICSIKWTSLSQVNLKDFVVHYLYSRLYLLEVKHTKYFGQFEKM